MGIFSINALSLPFSTSLKPSFAYAKTSSSIRDAPTQRPCIRYLEIMIPLNPLPQLPQHRRKKQQKNGYKTLKKRCIHFWGGIAHPKEFLPSSPPPSQVFPLSSHYTPTPTAHTLPLPPHSLHRHPCIPLCKFQHSIKVDDSTSVFPYGPPPRPFTAPPPLPLSSYLPLSVRIRNDTPPLFPLSSSPPTTPLGRNQEWQSREGEGRKEAKQTKEGKREKGRNGDR